VSTQALTERVGRHGDRLAIVDPGGSWTYATIDRDAAVLASVLVAERRGDGEHDRVAIVCTPGHDFVTALLACWHAGAIAVPLHPQHPDAELAYVVGDSGARAIIASTQHRDGSERVAATCGTAVVDVGAGGSSHRANPGYDLDEPALMVYTSGTTGRPKGAVHTHRGVAAMVDAMLAAWAWTADDRVVLVLPLNHVHGLINVTLCAVASGACCEAPGSFDAEHVWRRLASGEVTLFMAVPTIYTRLAAAWEQADGETRRAWSAGAAGLRLMVCGSAALPVSMLERWREISGHVLLERYGMTELGMVLSNTLDRRVPGHVGEPMPGMEVRIVDDGGADVIDGEPGELLVRGPQVFAGYWRRPEATAEAFTDGWFRTGDVALREPEGYRLLGRSSVDIIKTGGEKVSALEIEEVYRTHPEIADCAVVGIADDEWGERVCAAVVGAADADLDPGELRAWGKQQLASAKVPSRFLFVDELPRNTLGKVLKPEVTRLFS
jgi:malonyl-CoA/methylmalonyl-CoA synthetase